MTVTKEDIRKFINLYIDMLSYGKPLVDAIMDDPSAIVELAPAVDYLVKLSQEFADLVAEKPEIMDKFYEMSESEPCAILAAKKLPKRGVIPPERMRDWLLECLEVYELSSSEGSTEERTS